MNDLNLRLDFSKLPKKGFMLMHGYYFLWDLAIESPKKHEKTSLPLDEWQGVPFPTAGEKTAQDRKV